MKRHYERAKRYILGDPVPPVDALTRELLDDPNLRDSMRAAWADAGRQQQLAARKSKRSPDTRKRYRQNSLTLGVIIGLSATLVLVSEPREPKAEKPLRPKELLDMREDVLTNPEMLLALGYCATELDAQKKYDFSEYLASAGGADAHRAFRQDEAAQKLARIYQIPCDAQVTSVNIATDTRGEQQVFPGTLVNYDRTLWCVQRTAAVNNMQISAESRLAFVDAGDRVFGSHGRSCQTP